jgi:cytochrome c oxidase subunit 2
MKAVALVVTLVLIALACLYLFIVPPWWFPAGASAHAAALDHQFKVAFVLLGILFLAGHFVLAVLMGRARRNRPSQYSRGHWGLEILWTAVIAAIFFWFNVSGERLWSHTMFHPKDANAVHVEVTGRQFQWYFRYPGADGILGRTDAQKFGRPEEGNPLGIDPSDPAGKDDVVSPALVLPMGREADLSLRSQDVIHSVFIPAMRFKQDTVPGMVIHAHFTPTQTGTFELACSQLCGLGHYHMTALVRVVSDDEFNAWLKERQNVGPARETK